MTRGFKLAILVAAGVLTVRCGGGGGGGGGGSSSGPVTAPSAPSGPTGQTQPPGVNVSGTPPAGGQAQQIPWNGDVSFDQQTGPNTIALQLTQTGARVNGTVNVFGTDGSGGPISGTVSDSTLSFNFSVGNKDQGCGDAMSGTAAVATSTMTATFSGQTCKGTPVTNGKFTVSLPSPFRTSPYPVGGIWTTTTPPALGGGRWTFNISETPVDVNGSNVTGSVTVTGGSLNFGNGSLTGSVINTFAGPTTIARMTVTFAGACPSNLQFTEGFPGGNPNFDGSLMTGSASGTTCSGSPSQVGLNLVRQ